MTILIHYAARSRPDNAACGSWGPPYNNRLEPRPHVTRNPTRVTCKQCRATTGESR